MYLGVIKSSYSEKREAAALNKGFCDSSFSADIAKQLRTPPDDCLFFTSHLAAQRLSLGR